MGRWAANAQWVFAGILPLVLVLAVLRLAHYRSDREHLLQDQADRFRTEYETVLHGLQAQARFVYQESLTRPAVLAEVRAGWHAADELERARHRDRLYALLERTYANLLDAGFRQFHFHFPDCTSFLRLHRPGLFGDPLAGVRETVVAVNRDLVPVVSFEEGRIFNAYRNVFPLVYEGEHVGSVEIGFSLQGIRTTLESQIGGQHQLIVAGEVVRRKVFAEELSNYAEWSWSDDYLLDAAASPAALFYDHAQLPQRDRLRRQIAAGLATGGDFNLALRVDGMTHILQFTAIRNFLGRQVAYWVFLHENEPLEELRANALVTTAVYLVVILLLLGALFWMRRLQAKLREAASFLPVCSACKKVRPVQAPARDPDSWISLEEYFTRQTEARFTHGLCPECFRKIVQENDL